MKEQKFEQRKSMSQFLKLETQIIKLGIPETFALAQGWGTKRGVAGGKGLRGHAKEFGTSFWSSGSLLRRVFGKTKGHSCWLPLLLGRRLYLLAWLTPQPPSDRRQYHHQEKAEVGLKRHQLCNLTWPAPTASPGRHPQTLILPALLARQAQP